jgi:hypothetical protein
MQNTEENKKIEEARPKISGWLWFLGFGIVLNPLRILSNLTTNYIPLLKNGAIFTVFQNNRALGQILIIDFIGAILLLCGALYLVCLFFDRSKKFPPALILIYLINCGFLAFEYFLIKGESSIQDKVSSEILVNICVVMIYFCLWTPYLLFSKQVEQ